MPGILLNDSIRDMNFNVSLFFKINKLVGKNRWLDLFGKAGAEWVIIAMLGWYVTSVLIRETDPEAIILRLIVLGGAWVVGWLLNIFIGSIVKEPRPHITYPQSNILFQPMMSWKSFPSDHAFSAWLIFFMAFMFNLSGLEAIGVMALWVSWGRVFAGLHYPFDIVGGLAVAGLMVAASYNVLVMFF